jgi:hypothetical protein
VTAPEPYVYTLRINPGLRELVKLYAASRNVSFNRALTELLETHPSVNLIYRRLIERANPPDITSES